MGRPILVVLALSLSGCGIPASAGMWFQIKRYSGDGHIYSCSNLVSSGYCIDFPDFDAKRPFAASYRLAHVPRVLGRDPLIYLKFRCDFGSSDEIKRRVTASFRVTQLDSSGAVIRASTFPMAAAIWSDSQYLCGAYDMDKSPLRFSTSGSYILKVSYDPGTVPPPTKRLYFSLDNCAFY